MLIIKVVLFNEKCFFVLSWLYGGLVFGCLVMVLMILILYCVCV